MKKLSLLFIAITLSLASCKQEKKETKTEDATEVSSEAKFVVKPEATKVKFTAYKTTDKVGVGGEFTTVKFDEKSGATPEEALNNLDFSIPVSSLFTNDATNTRDAKIIASFFGAMLDTDLITGTIKFVNGSAVAEVTMNGETQNLPMDVTITDERRVTLTGTMNLANWKALDALASLNKACEALHTGADGVSKTWEDVAIEVSTFLRDN
ncbi:YceI family protein [Tamlana sp. 2_MG-2023]|uniref:YceI family protein n=1 Tax=unclassified Tamlana TaxID=2614803 RepID=UPI0026E483A8|nr:MULTISPECIES: YceI family protein [unclassified Tamlana]MDO6758687.1 YceI family protein [Tamlana sp. 2_MG-2023]MDO6789386.1 YceI family protein [Tamlana sp. 1_MG-2023]